MRAFVNEGLKEFVITKIISPHPAGIQAFDFQVTYVQQKQCLVTEFLMEKGGETLTEFFKKPSNNFDFVKYFTQLSSLMQHMEKEQIFHSDVKFDNCLIDPKGNFRIIDYDVAKAEGYYSATTKLTTNNILGYTNGYVPPEIYNQIEEAIRNNKPPSAQNVLPWRADIYSCGILGLCISGAIDEVERGNLQELDVYKDNNTNHQYIIDKCKLIKCNNDSLSKKMQYVLEVCLSYDPKMRITFKQLHFIMKKIKDSDYDLKKLQQEVEIYRNENKEFMTKSQLLHNKQDLQLQLDQMIERNQKIENVLKEVNERYKKAIKSLEDHRQKLNELRQKTEKFEESIRKNQEIMHKNDNEKSEVIANFINGIQSSGFNSNIEIKEFSQVIPIFNSILKEHKIVKEENLKLKNERNEIQTTKPLTNIGQFSPRNLRKDIQEKISNENFWNLDNMKLSKEDILQILLIATASKSLKGINFC